MKTLLALTVILLAGFAAHSQNAEDENFLVIGTFRNQINAEKFVAQLNRNGLKAYYGLRTDLNLYYVYTKETSSKEEALAHLAQIKSKPEFKNAWMFTGKLGSEIMSVGPQDELPLTRSFSFIVISKADGKELNCEVLIHETDGSSIQWAKSGNLLFIGKPLNRHGSFTVSTMVPGFRMGTLVFFYDHPSVHKGANGEEIVTLMLEPSSGENYVGFNTVHFIGNTTSLLKASLAELDEFAEFLKAAPDEQIIIHGYCTDKQQLQYTSEGSENNSFKSLSLARAEMIKNFLVQQGVESWRIKTTGEDALHKDVKYFDSYNRVVVEFKTEDKSLF